MDMTVDARPPVLKMALSWVHCGSEAVDEFWPTFGQREELAHMVWNPLDLSLFELVLGGLSQFSAMLTKHAVSTLGGVHPDAVVMIPQGEVVGLECVQKLQTHLVILGDPVCLLLWTTASTEWREIPQVTEVDLVVGFPTFGEVQYLLFSLFRD
jgi:hypothetical protein